MVLRAMVSIEIIGERILIIDDEIGASRHSEVRRIHVSALDDETDTFIGKSVFSLASS